MLSSAALASVLTRSYRANLLLPQLKPPVNTVSQVNNDAVAREETKQNADKRQIAINDAKRADAQHLTTAAHNRAAVVQQQLAAKVSPPTDRVTVSRVSAIVEQTLVNTQTLSNQGGVAVSAPPKVVYTPRDVVQRAVVVEATPPTPILAAEVAVPAQSTSAAVAAQQYQRNAAPSSSTASGGGGSSTLSGASSGVNVRA